MNFGPQYHKRVKIGPEFSRTLCDFCVLLRCQVLHTEVSKRNLAIGLCMPSNGNLMAQ